MLRLVIRAIGARRSPAIAVGVLVAFAFAAAIAAPWYVLASAQNATASDVAQAPAAQRVVSVATDSSLAGDAEGALDRLTTALATALPVAGTPIRGMATFVDAELRSVPEPVRMAYRDDLCTHVAITGRCPAAVNEALLSPAYATLLGLAVGDALQVTTVPSIAAITLRVVGEYQEVDPGGPYWASRYFSGTGGGSGETTAGDPYGPVFVTLDTLSQPQVTSVTAAADLTVPAAAFQSRAADLAIDLAQAAATLQAATVQFTSSAGLLAETIATDTHLAVVGVGVGVAQLLLLSWYALFLAAGYTAEDRRGDVALVKLRGSSRWTLVRLTLGQSVPPILAGLVTGAVAALAAVRYGVGVVTGADRIRSAWQLSALAAGVTLAGAVLAIAVAEWRVNRAPVGELLRRVPPRRRGVRADVTDLVIVVLALAATFQAWAQHGTTTGVGLATVAPGLVALAVALVGARLIGYLANRAGGAALHAGRLRLAVGALQIARRPGTDRVFTLFTVAVAGLCTALLGWTSADHVRTVRATVDLGASRVLTVSAGDSTALLSAVRAADPTGRQAMAVARYPGAGDIPPVLAVDSTRFGVVAAWSPAYGPRTATQVSTALRVPAPPPVEVTGTGLALTATIDTPYGVYLVAHLVNEHTGAPVDVSFGPMRTGTDTSVATLTGCSGGCRLASVELAGSPGPLGTTTPPPSGATVAITLLGQVGPDSDVAGPAVLGDVTRWRTTTSIAGIGLRYGFSATDGRLTLIAGPPPDPLKRPDNRIYAADAVLPLPVVQAGTPAGDLTLSRSTTASFAGVPVPLSVVGSVPALPGLGDTGMLVDLDSLERATGDGGTGAVFGVWLAPGAPTSIVTALTGAGLTVVGDDTIGADEARLATQGPAAALRFQLLAALVGLLLSAAALTVAAAVERGPRGRELAALRMQGLGARAATTVGYGAYAVIVVAAVGVGVLAAMAGSLIAAHPPVFVDSWTVVPPDHGIHAGPIATGALVAVVVLGAVAVAAGRALVRTVKRRTAA